LVAAYVRRGETAEAEALVLRALELGLTPNEVTLQPALLHAIQQGQPERVEVLMDKMMSWRLPQKDLHPATKDAFNDVLGMFVQRRDALKVEHWLLKAGQSGCTPGQDAFDAVVLLFAEVDPAKAEEWLSRALRTEYRLPDSCFEAVIRAWLRTAQPDAVSKANHWLSKMHGDQRVPSDDALREAVHLSTQECDVVHAEAWITQLLARGDGSVDDLRRGLFNAALTAGDCACAERQLAALQGAEPDRTQRLIVAFAEEGQAARSKAVLERYRALGGPLTPEMGASVLTACAAVGDAEGAEAVARALSAGGVTLSNNQAAVLRQLLGERRFSALAAGDYRGYDGSEEPSTAPASTLSSPMVDEGRSRNSSARGSPKGTTRRLSERGGTASKVVSKNVSPKALSRRDRAGTAPLP
jgi:hypothetical protein